MNTSSDETLTETTVRVYGSYGSWEYDISKDEGIVKALQQSHLQVISAAATDRGGTTTRVSDRRSSAAARTASRCRNVASAVRASSRACRTPDSATFSSVSFRS